MNVIWDLAVHDLSILDYLMDDKPVAVTASGAGHVGGSPENIARITLFYPSGAVANLNVNWLAPVKVRQTLIGGSRKMIVYDDLEPSEKIKVYDRGVSVMSNPDEVAGTARFLPRRRHVGTAAVDQGSAADRDRALHRLRRERR